MKINVCIDKEAEWHNGELFFRVHPTKIVTQLETRHKFFWITGDVVAQIRDSAPLDTSDNPPMWVISLDDRDNEMIYTVEAFVVHKGGDSQVFIEKCRTLNWPKHVLS